MVLPPWMVKPETLTVVPELTRRTWLWLLPLIVRFTPSPVIETFALIVRALPFRVMVLTAKCGTELNRVVDAERARDLARLAGRQTPAQGTIPIPCVVYEQGRLAQG